MLIKKILGSVYTTTCWGENAKLLFQLACSFARTAETMAIRRRALEWSALHDPLQSGAFSAILDMHSI